MLGKATKQWPLGFGEREREERKEAVLENEDRGLVNQWSHVWRRRCDSKALSEWKSTTRMSCNFTFPRIFFASSDLYFAQK